MRKTKLFLALSLLLTPSLTLCANRETSAFNAPTQAIKQSELLKNDVNDTIRADIINRDTIVYTGKECKPSLYVYDLDAEQYLVEGTDYSVEYKGEIVEAGRNSAYALIHFLSITHSDIICRYSILPRPVNIIWPNDTYVENGEVQTINPYYVDVNNKQVALIPVIKQDGVVTDFKDPGIYQVDAIEDHHDTNYQLSNTHREYMMRWLYESTSETIDDLPIAIAYSDYGVDPHLHLEASVVNPSFQKDKFNQLAEKLKEDPSYSLKLDKVYAIYDTALVDEAGVHHKAENNVSMSVLIPKAVKGGNVRVYRVSTEEVRLVKYDVFDDNYVSVGMIDFDNFAIVYSYEDLTWLIIVLSVVIALLVLLLVFIITYQGMRVAKRKGGH